MAKKRAFIRYTKKGKIVPGSLIVTTEGGYPKDGVYKEVGVYFNDTFCPECVIVPTLWKYNGTAEPQTLAGTVYSPGSAFGCGDIDFYPGDVKCILFFCTGSEPGPEFENLGPCNP